MSNDSEDIRKAVIFVLATGATLTPVFMNLTQIYIQHPQQARTTIQVITYGLPIAYLAMWTAVRLLQVFRVISDRAAQYIVTSAFALVIMTWAGISQIPYYTERKKWAMMLIGALWGRVVFSGIDVPTEEIMRRGSYCTLASGLFKAGLEMLIIGSPLIAVLLLTP